MGINEKTTLHFDEKFFQEEKRCGFIVTEKLKKIWAIELDLADKLIKVCNKHNIKLFVFAGTLLGAIRHKGFIPWDDDFDVVMTREDFLKLQEIAPKEFNDPYFLQSNISDKQYFMGYGRLRNSLTTGHILDYKSENYNQGIYIDVYVADGCVNEDYLLKIQLNKLFCIHKLIDIYKHNNESKTFFKRTIKQQFIILYPFLKLIGLERLEKLYYKEITKYTKSAEMLSTLTHELSIIKRAKFNKKNFENVIYVPFENIEVPVPADYDEMLKRMYGNYMVFPPEQDRGAWHNNVIYFDPETPYKEYFRQKKKR